MGLKGIFFLVLFVTLIFMVSSNVAEAGLELTLDEYNVTFGVMSRGEQKELADQGSYHNEVTCKSTNNKTWYLKIHSLRPLTDGAKSIPDSNFKWTAVWTDGSGTLMNPLRFNEFTSTPSLVYISGPDDNSGDKVHIQFKYGLSIPDGQVSGRYSTIVRFTMTETL